MRNRVKKIDLKKFKQALVTGAQAAFINDFVPNQIVPEIEARIRELFDQTVEHWEGGSGTPGTSKLTRTEPRTPQLHVDVTETRLGAVLEVYVDSYIWNLLNQGRDDRITSSVERLVPREHQRTIPGTLTVDSDRTYSKEIYVAAGTTIAGFKPRGWTEIIAETIQDEFGSKYPFISVQFTVKDNL